MDMKKGRSSIGDLDDNLLIDIFIRLPSYESVISSKLVSKQWFTLISDPKFVIEFLNHKKKKNQHQKLPWGFLKTMRVRRITKTTINKNKMKFNSRKYSTKFLTSPFKVAATFKDLVLSLKEGSNKLIISNPLTRHSVFLPATPPSMDLSKCWATLLCEDPFYNSETQLIDYKFRVVLIHIPDIPSYLPQKVYDLSTLFNMTVYCSEDSQWRSTHLRVSLIPRTRRPHYSDPRAFRAVVCKGMVCVCFNQYFGMFNPFAITATRTSIEAITLPLPPLSGFHESGGKLIAINTSCTLDPLPPHYQHCGVALTMKVFELDLNRLIHNINSNNNQQQVNWSYIFRGECIDTTGSLSAYAQTVRLIGFHPTDKHWLYISTPDNKFVLCDIRSSSMKILGFLPPNNPPIHSSERILPQYWPTPLPAIPG